MLPMALDVTPVLATLINEGEIPDEVDLSFYRSLYADLSKMSDEQLIGHYTQYGQNEGRLATPAAIRCAFLKLIQTTKSTLEIGPFYKPSLTGPNVKYFDVLDSKDLVERGSASVSTQALCRSRSISSRLLAIYPP